MNQPDPTLQPYAAGLAELHNIVEELEDGEVDVDVLSSRVERAVVLVSQLRERIESARMEVTRVVATLEADNTADRLE